MTTRLLFVRHAESHHSVSGTVGGARTDRGLTGTGHAQAAALAERLATDPVTAIYTSTLPRAIQTAEPLARALNLPITEDCRLCTWHYPPWCDGLPKTDLPTRALAGAGVYRPFEQDSETWADLAVRNSKAIFDIAHTHAGATTAIVAHGETVSTSFVALGNSPLYTAFDVALSYATITEWTTTDPPTQFPPARWTLHRLNA